MACDRFFGTTRHNYEVLLGLVCVCLFVLSIVPSTGAQSSRYDDPVYLLLLIDASGSIKGTDPDNLRKLAAQTVASLLSQRDRVAVVEFSSDARILCGFTEPADLKKIFSAVEEAGNNGEFTDFRSGLHQAAGLLKKAPSNSRKVILLLSDGMFEPNLRDDTYAPYNLQYKKAIWQKSRDEKKRITREFTKKVLVKAHRIIDTDIVPRLQEYDGEVYTIGLGGKADREFLNSIAERTSLNNSEVHSFYAESATDLTESFLKILKYTQNKMLVHRESGSIDGETDRLFIDKYLNKVLFIVYSKEQYEFELTSEDGTKQTPITGTHPSLTLVPIDDTSLPSDWSYRFTGGDGAYSLIVVGQSTLEIEVKNLKRRYFFGDRIEAGVLLTIDGEDALQYLDNSTRVHALITETDKQQAGDKSVLPRIDRSFAFNFEPEISGTFEVQFNVEARDRTFHRDILPRLSKRYVFDVVPGFYVEPEHINFGDVKKGKEGKTVVRIHSGIREQANVRAAMEITASSRKVDKDKRNKLPQSDAIEFTLAPRQVTEREIRILVPKGGIWGDHEGVLNFKMAGYESQQVFFRVHVPSIWEWLTNALLILLLLATLLIGYLSYIWGKLGTPVGILQPLKAPGNEVLHDIKLSKVHKGILTKVFNVRKHIVSIASTRANVTLERMPPDMKVELQFFRFGGAFVANASHKKSDSVIEIKSDLGELPRRPGESFALRHDLKIRFAGYEYIYRRF